MAASVHQLPGAATAPVVNPKRPGRWRKNISSLAKARRSKQLEALEREALMRSERQQDVAGAFMALHDLARKGEVTGFAGVYTENGKVYQVLFGDLRDDLDTAWKEVMRLSALLFKQKTEECE